MSNEITREAALEIARLCQELGITVSLKGVRCLIEVHDNKYGVLVCGKNKTKLSLAKHWGEVKEQIRRELERIRRDVERALELVIRYDRRMDDVLTVKVMVWKRKLFLKPIPPIHDTSLLGRQVDIALLWASSPDILEGIVLTGTWSLYPGRPKLGLVIALSRREYLADLEPFRGRTISAILLKVAH